MTELTTAQPTKLMPAVYPADQHPALVYVASLGSGSRRTMRGCLDRIADMLLPGSDAVAFPWHQLRYQHTQAVRVALSEQYSPSTANKHLYAMRGALKEAWRLGYMDAENYQRAIDLKTVSGSRAKQAEVGRHITMGEFSALIQNCLDGSKAGIRDAAIIAVGYTAGLRRSELAALQVADYDEDACTLHIRASKGNKDRIVPIANGACDAVDDWLHVRGRVDGALFLAIRRGDNMTGDGMSDQSIYNVLVRRADQAGVKEFSPHDLRRTFAGDLLDAGADLSTVQKLMGHSSPDITAGYDRRDGRAKREAVSRLHIPYTKQF